MLSTLRALLKTPLYRFLLNAVAFYVAWYLVYEIWIHPIDTIDIWVVKLTMNTARKILDLFGFVTFQYKIRLIGIDGASGLWMGDNCDSIELCAIFMGFIIAFPGFWKQKLWYIPMGFVIITIMNIIRVIALAIIQRYCSKSLLDFNHTYTFNILVYGAIFAMWYMWIRKVTQVNIGKEPHSK
jgi:exosortase/archaeosortase family protein